MLVNNRLILTQFMAICPRSINGSNCGGLTGKKYEDT